MSTFKAAPGLHYGKLVKVSSEPKDEPPPPDHLVTLTLRSWWPDRPSDPWPEDTAAGVVAAMRAGELDQGSPRVRTHLPGR